ncbi:MAG: SCO family protein [Rhodospirillales bacterium]|nr:SCO family protein [Rhodospirillales bacterium]
MQRLFTILCLGIVLIVVGAWTWNPVQSAEETPGVSSHISIGGAFTLIDHNGKTVTDANFRGRYMLVYFGYTFCPDVCPTALQTITDAMDLLGAKADKVQPVFISVDPERDTPKVLKSFMENFHPRMIGLTGSSEQVAAVAKIYRLYYAKASDEDDYLIDHQAFIYLMGPDGKIITYFPHGIAPDAIATKVRKHL